MLPTESLQNYQADLQALLQELEANTPLKVYLVENIHECLLWIRRYRAQKRNLVLRAIATLLYERQPS